ncbi:hypothetical protein OSB04_013582 [Centaurea solstitialis]|uniref:Uncharacterized protein n=1 Tax=Centaurea solstitialis TaxID=347529 RepID=A0AA38TYA8_9ASTR|nr:hypothetical protein OSB04_013582 [Centaurea solstitialis]
MVIVTPNGVRKRMPERSKSRKSNNQHPPSHLLQTPCRNLQESLRTLRLDRGRDRRLGPLSRRPILRVRPPAPRPRYRPLPPRRHRAVENPQPPLLAVNRFNEHYAEFSRELEMEKKRGRELVPGRSGGGSRWYEEAVDGMEVEELEQYFCSLEQLKKKVSMRADELMMINKTPSLLGSNVIGRTGFNDSYVQTTVDVPATVHGGFDFHHG